MLDLSKNLLLQDVAEFVCKVLDLKCSDSLTDTPQIKSFLDLVVVDGDATFSHNSSYLAVVGNGRYLHVHGV